ncbi:response regulator [Fundidesulfovibrio butyratiphilus]
MELQRILMAEDENDIATVAKMALEMVGGFTVEVCSSGEEVLAGFERFKPDLVLLDVMMPGQDGPTTLAALRKLPGGASIPVVFMTAKVMPNEVEELMNLGVLGVVPKPFDPMALPDKIRELWNKARASK